MSFTLLGFLTVFGMLAGTLGLLEVGRRLGLRRLARDPESAKAGAGAMEGAVFGLMGLLIAFTFSGAGTRFDTRRAVAIEEVNCIGTVWLRLDLLPASAQPPLREKFRQYVDARLAFLRTVPDIAAAEAEQTRAGVLQTEIWTQAVAACRDSASSPATMLLLPALNQMFDIATTRTTGMEMHPPVIIYAMLALLVLAGALLAGYGMVRARSTTGFTRSPLCWCSCWRSMSLRFELPRVGLIRINAIDRVLLDLRESMKP